MFQRIEFGIAVIGGELPNRSASVIVILKKLLTLEQKSGVWRLKTKMPATAQKVTKEPSRSSGPSEDWTEFLRLVDPLDSWKKDFSEWRENVKTFLESENKFFSNRDKEFWQRVHRGWLCALISEGERLAVELLKDQQQQNATREFELLNLCIENLQATLETWHFTDKIDLLESRA